MPIEQINFLDRVLIIECVSSLPEEKFVVENDIPIYRNYYGALVYGLNEKMIAYFTHEKSTDRCIVNVNKLIEGKIEPSYYDFLK